MMIRMELQNVIYAYNKKERCMPFLDHPDVEKQRYCLS